MITCFILFLLFHHSIAKAHRRRYDGSPSYPYWRARDFGLLEEKFSFYSGKWRLSGSRYFIKGASPKALVVFFHGIGDGRASYIKEIASLAEQGYLVYAYDNTGCMESEGPCIYGLGQTNRDMTSFFSWLDNDKESQGLTRYVVGHSWGGYGALMATDPRFKAAKCVSFAGFTRPSSQYAAMTRPRFFAHFSFLIHLSLVFDIPHDGDKDAIKVMKSSKAKILYIQGDKDPMVPPSCGYQSISRAFVSNPRVEVWVRSGRSHQVYKTSSSERYIYELLDKGIASPLRNKGLTMDLKKATEHDEEVWQRVFDFLSK